MSAFKTLICDRHAAIMSVADRKIKEIFSFRRSLNEETSIDDIDCILSDIESSLDEIYQEAEAARQSGVSMEARLRDYRDTIASLGFERKVS